MAKKKRGDIEAIPHSHIPYIIICLTLFFILIFGGVMKAFSQTYVEPPKFKKVGDYLINKYGDSLGITDGTDTAWYTATGGSGSGTADSLGIDVNGDGTVDNYLYSTTAGAFHIKKGSNITLAVTGDTVTINGDAATFKTVGDYLINRWSDSLGITDGTDTAWYTAAGVGGTSDSLGIDADGNGTVDNYLYSTTAGAFHIKKGSNITLTVTGDTVTIGGDAAAGTADSIGIDTDGDGAINNYLYSTAGAIAMIKEGAGITLTVDTDTLSIATTLGTTITTGEVTDSTLTGADINSASNLNVNKVLADTLSMGTYGGAESPRIYMRKSYFGDDIMWMIHMAAGGRNLIIRADSSPEGGCLTLDGLNDRVGIMNVVPDSTLDVTGAGHFTTNLFVGGDLNITGDMSADSGYFTELVVGSGGINLGGHSIYNIGWIVGGLMIYDTLMVEDAILLGATEADSAVKTVKYIEENFIDNDYIEVTDSAQLTIIDAGGGNTWIGFHDSVWCALALSVHGNAYIDENLLILGDMSADSGYFKMIVAKDSIKTDGSTSGTIILSGATSGSASITVADVAGTPTELILPTTDGSNGYQLTTDGSGALSWAAAGSGASSDVDTTGTQIAAALGDRVTTTEILAFLDTAGITSLLDTITAVTFPLADSATNIDTTGSGFTTYVTNHAGGGSGWNMDSTRTFIDTTDTPIPMSDSTDAITDGGIDHADLGANIVDSNNIADGAIRTNEILDYTILTADLAWGLNVDITDAGDSTVVSPVTNTVIKFDSDVKVAANHELKVGANIISGTNNNIYLNYNGPDDEDAAIYAYDFGSAIGAEIFYGGVENTWGLSPNVQLGNGGDYVWLNVYNVADSLVKTRYWIQLEIEDSLDEYIDSAAIHDSLDIVRGESVTDANLTDTLDSYLDTAAIHDSLDIVRGEFAAFDTNYTEVLADKAGIDTLIVNDTTYFYDSTNTMKLYHDGTNWVFDAGAGSSYCDSTGEVTDGTIDSLDLNDTQLNEYIEDAAGAMLGGTETGIAVTYQDATDDIDFVVSTDIVNHTLDSAEVCTIVKDSIANLEAEIESVVDLSDLQGTLGASQIGNQHFRLTIVDPDAVYATDAEICITPRTEGAMTITRIDVTCDADPTAEFEYSLKWADAFIGFANAAVIEDTATVAGVTTVTSVTGDATVPANKCLYLLIDADPDDDITQVSIDVTYDFD